MGPAGLAAVEEDGQVVGDQGDLGVVGAEEPASGGEGGPVVPFGAGAVAEVVADRGPRVQLDRDFVVADGTGGPQAASARSR